LRKTAQEVKEAIEIIGGKREQNADPAVASIRSSGVASAGR
jgi:hypothetical protein